MSPFLNGLPALDTHAHIAANVTPAQVHRLGGAIVFAMTRSLDEARQAQQRRSDATLVWGVGVHPAVRTSLAAFEPAECRRLLARAALIGEVGLDQRGDRASQGHVLDTILQLARDEPVLISLHSTGLTERIVDVLERRPHPGAILHWFTGDDASVRRAIKAGCHFSVNAGMKLATLASLPLDRILTETDFPSKLVRAKQPGDVQAVESALADIHRVSPADIRRTVWQNLRQLCLATGAIDRLPEPVADLLIAA